MNTPLDPKVEREFPGYLYRFCTCGHRWSEHGDKKVPWWSFEIGVGLGPCGICVCDHYVDLGEYTEGEIEAMRKASRTTPPTLL